MTNPIQSVVTHRFKRRASRMSASVSTNTFMSSMSKISGLWNTRMPSKIITLAPYMVFVVVSRACVTKLYMGTSTLRPSLSLRNTSIIRSMSNASGWSKLYSLRSAWWCCFSLRIYKEPNIHINNTHINLHLYITYLIEAVHRQQCNPRNVQVLNNLLSDSRLAGSTATIDAFDNAHIKGIAHQCL